MNTTLLLNARDQATEALKESEQRYKRLLAATTDYIYTVHFEDGFSSTFHGPGCEGVTGYSQADFSADPYLWVRIIHEEDRARVLDQINRFSAGQLAGPMEHRILHRDGSVRWIQNTTIPHYGEGGRLVGYDGLIKDITERKLSEQAVRESQERLALVIRGSNDGIWDWNLQTDEVYFSPRWKSMLGYTDQEIQNRFPAWEALMHPEDLLVARERVRAYLAGESPSYELEHRLRHKNGSYRWILARGVLQRDGEGRPVRLVGSHMDLTDLKDSAEQLKRVNEDLVRTRDRLVLAARFESMGTLAAGVAHEVKNPLQTILLGIHYLTQKLAAPEEDIAQTLQDMCESVTRANAIISDLLTLSRATTFTPRIANLNTILQHCLRLTRIEMDTSGVTPVIRLAEDLPPVLVDQAKMEQAFLNLFVNAIQAMAHGGGTLTVTTWSVLVGDDPAAVAPLLGGLNPGERVVLAEIRDVGTGIKPVDLPRVFDPFFTTKPAGSGTGLGLSIARMILDRHGGAIDIQNAPDRGVVVTIAIRAATEG